MEAKYQRAQRHRRGVQVCKILFLFCTEAESCGLLFGPSGIAIELIKITFACKELRKNLEWEKTLIGLEPQVIRNLFIFKSLQKKNFIQKKLGLGDLETNTSQLYEMVLEKQDKVE